MNKGLKAFSAGILGLSLVACSSKGKLVSGTFSGEAVGMGGKDHPVKVTLILKDNAITNVEITADHETDGIGTKAIDALTKTIVEQNSVSVDGVSGATITSDAIKEAATKALESAGLKPSDLQSKQATITKAQDIQEDVDVVVVGAGGAGMVAAITASDAGKKVIIVESQAMAGGNTVRSTGGLNAANTPYQDKNTFNEGAGVEKTLKNAKEKYADNAVIMDLVNKVQEQYDAYLANPEGYFDTAELMELDTLLGGYAKNNPDLVEILTSQSANAITWLDQHGATLSSVGAAGGASVKRIHRPVNAEGKTLAVGEYIVPVLEKNVTDRGIQVIYDTTIESITTKDGKAVGVVGKGKTGNQVNIQAKAVVIATGGFGANFEMVEQYRPELKGFATTNADGALGQGITMATAIGADTVDMDQIQIHPTVHVEENGNAHLITEGVRGDGAILVNKDGKRFFDEVNTRDKVSAAEIAQKDGEVWLILDQAMIDGSAVYQGYVNYGYAKTGETPEALAKEIGVDEATFAQTMKDWQTIYANKQDPEFGRTSFSSEYGLNQAPYYAILVKPGIHHTMGGLKIDQSAQVLDKNGTPIAGLFAAGEVTGGVHGGNRLGGTAVTDIVVFGQIAGQSAANYAK